MLLPHDYGSAAARHWEDAISLTQANRFDNGAYLAGYVVECSLKSMIEISGTSPKPFQHDLATLSGDALLLACLMAPGLRRYNLPGSPDFLAMSQDWTPEHRYCPSGQVPEATARLWLRVAEETYRAIVVNLILDGHRYIP